MVEENLIQAIQAEKKGLPYQSYIKSVLHEELIKREERQAS